MYTHLQIAHVCYNANAALQYENDESFVPPPWHALAQPEREGYAEGVRFALGGRTPREQHDEWVRARTEAGWAPGALYDPDSRTHPDLRPYDELPAAQKVKDRLFLAIVATLADAA